MHYLLSLVSLLPALYHAIQRFNEGNTSLSAIAQTTENGVLVRIEEPSNDDDGNIIVIMIVYFMMMGMKRQPPTPTPHFGKLLKRIHFPAFPKPEYNSISSRSDVF